jgi:hypothetical protein
MNGEGLTGKRERNGGVFARNISSYSHVLICFLKSGLI